MGKRVNMDLVGLCVGELRILHVTRSKTNRLLYRCICSCGTPLLIRPSEFNTCKPQLRCNECQKKHMQKTMGKGSKDIHGRYLSRIKNRARRDNISCSLTIEDLQLQWDKQKGICSLSGIELTTYKTGKQRTQKNCHNASVDRVDSKKGYEVGNIEWIHKKLQEMKLDKDKKEFIRDCKEVAEYASSVCV